MKFQSNRFNEMWALDFEFFGDPGDRPTPVCMVAHELITGKKNRIWIDELKLMQKPPFEIGKDNLFIAYYASAEISCFLALEWPIPLNILDLYTEFRNLTNGLKLPAGRGLIGASIYFGLNSLGALQKKSMRDLVLSGGPWTNEEKISILDYCESDVNALSFLLEKMVPSLDLPRALIRGRYMVSVAKIEHHGIPIDAPLYEGLQENWEAIKSSLISRIDVNYGVFEGQRFKVERFKKYLASNGLPWPLLESGALDLKDDTFREMSRSHPQVAALRELRVALSQMRLSDLSIGKDGRNRCMLSAFQARTGRNAPSNSKFIFGPSVWLRGLIKPQPGNGLAYIDWSQQEFGIAAKLSNDRLMMDAYRSGDPYLGFAKQAGTVPSNATKKSHYNEREQFKACVLAINYGMGEDALAARIGQPPIEARELLNLHRQTYQVFWRWSDGVLDYAMLYGKIWTTFGWKIHITDKPNPRMLRNFLIQANGAEMLRLACCLILDKGINICAPIHDAVLIEAPINEIEEKIKITQEAMAEATRIILNGFELNSDVTIICFPDRYMDQRGRKMWTTIIEILQNILQKSSCNSQYDACANLQHIM